MDSGSGACFGIVSQLTVNENTVNFINSRMYMSEVLKEDLHFVMVEAIHSIL